MCQAKVFLKADGNLEKIMEDVTEIEVFSGGIRISAFFESPRELAGARIEKIDFLTHTVTLELAKKE